LLVLRHGLYLLYDDVGCGVVLVEVVGVGENRLMMEVVVVVVVVDVEACI